MVAPLLIGAGMMAGGMLADTYLRNKGNKKALDLLKKAQERIAAIKEPTEDDLRLVLQPLVQQGIITPEEYQTYQVKPSAFTEIAVDPTGRNAELEALSQLKGIVDQGGQDAQFRAAMAKAGNEANLMARGQNEAILQNAAARGTANSNLTAAMQSAEAANAANRLNMAGTQAAGMAEQRALDALINRANIGQGMTAQDYKQAADRAAAIDAINKFNTQNMQSQSNLNVGARNEAQAKNLGLAQEIANQNIGFKNTAAERQANIPQQIFQNKLSKEQAAMGGNTNMANLITQGAGQQASLYGNVLGGMGQMIGSYGTAPQARHNPTVNPPQTAGVGGYKTPYQDDWYASKGGRVPGKAPVNGDSPKNDVVSAKLSPGEIVIPRSHAKSPEMVADFVRHLPKSQKVHHEDVRSVLKALTDMRSMNCGGMV